VGKLLEIFDFLAEASCRGLARGDEQPYFITKTVDNIKFYD